MIDSWSKIEVALIIADYFDMLIKELNRMPYKKADHRRQLLPLLNKRSAGSIEFKHQNISAILIILGKPYINGYLPLYNYQILLEEEVIDYLKHHSEIEFHFQKFVEKDIIKSKSNIDFSKIIVSPPENVSVTEPNVFYQHKPIKINYLEKEQSNKALGLYGEEIVIEYEKWNLIRSGKYNLLSCQQWYDG